MAIEAKIKKDLQKENPFVLPSQEETLKKLQPNDPLLLIAQKVNLDESDSLLHRLMAAASTNAWVVL